MSAPTNHWKLGAFVLGSVVLGLVVTVALTARAMRVATVDYTSFFDEAVTGLGAGSAVSFRGVNIGTVSSIGVAPDRRHVEVVYALDVAVLKRQGLSDPGGGPETRLSVPPDLRAQIVSTGLTGARCLQLDFFEAGEGPPPVLPFPVPANSIPATRSTMKTLEDGVARTVAQLPDLSRQLGGVVARLDVLLDDVNGRRLPAQAAATLGDTRRLLAGVQARLDALPVEELSREAAGTLARLNRALDRLDGDEGLVASAQRASDAVGDLAGQRLGENLDQTGRDVREAAVAVRQLIEALQRDPDMLLKGKTKVAR